jgi:hypothetical protein
MLSTLVLLLLPNRTKSWIILHLMITLMGTWCIHVGLVPCFCPLIPNLLPPKPCEHHCLLNVVLHVMLIHARLPIMRGSTLMVRSVMASWSKIDGAMMKLRASCGGRHKVGLLGTRWYRGL